MNDLSPFSHISPEARIGSDVRIGPFVHIEPGVELGDGCVVDCGAVLRTGTRLGARVHIHPYAVIGGFPQDYRFNPENHSGVVIGEGTVIRESVTVNRATVAGGATRIGSGCMLMAGAHVAHDCTVGDQVTIANAALLAGHVVVEDRAFISGGAVVHQFNRVGNGSMISGNSRITLDVPPYLMVAERNEVSGLNLVGLRRRGFPRDTIAEIKGAFHAVYGASSLHFAENAAEALRSGAFASAEARAFLEFFAISARRTGFVRPRRDSRRPLEV